MRVRVKKQEFTDWEARVSSVKDGNAVLQAYVNEWIKDKAPPLKIERLNFILFGESGPASNAGGSAVATAIADQVRLKEASRRSMEPLMAELKQAFGASANASYLPILIALLVPDEFSAVLSPLMSAFPVEKRTDALRTLVVELNRVLGRERTREFIKALWGQQKLLEEEKETLIEAAVEERIFDWVTLSSLSSEARPMVLRLLTRGNISARDFAGLIGGHDFNFPDASPPDDATRQRVLALAQQAVIAIRTTHSGFQPHELGRLRTAWLHPILGALALVRHRRMFHDPFIEDFFHIWGRDWPSPLYSTMQAMAGNTGSPLLGIALIRVLHMRLILESRSLSSALARPENALVPEVLLYLFGQEGVTYSPEMSIPTGAAPGWRRRWAESTAEAFSTLLLEDALALDLSTLVRIQESGREKSPDFMVRTHGSELIVFESKGSTNWESFRKSKWKALQQLSKDGSLTAWQHGAGWTTGNRGRSFACCLFVTSGSEAYPSQLHVEDPPFPFESLFHEGWEAAARRRHYSAVLQTAGFLEEANALAAGNGFEVSEASDVRTLGLANGALAEFRGRTINAYDVATLIGYPQPEMLRKVKVFAGIEKELLYTLAQRGLPPGRPFDVGIDEDIVQSEIPPTGILPSQNPKQRSKGVFSRLSNGSYLAVTVEE